MFCSFLKGAKLCAWLSQPDCPSAVKECKVLLDRAYGAHNEHVDPFEDNIQPPDGAKRTNVPPDLCKLIGQHTTILCAHLRHTGITYSRSSTNLGNSQVLFYPNGNRSLAGVPGIIKYIYEVEGAMMFAVQRRAMFPGNTNKFDAFWAYPHFPAKLYPARIAEELEPVKMSWIIGHYASWLVSPDELVVLSLCRVSL